MNESAKGADTRRQTGHEFARPSDGAPDTAPVLGEYAQNNGVKALVEDIAKALVDTPAGVVVNEIAGEYATVFELRVADGDLGKVIGKQGRTARSIRTLLTAVGTKMNRRFTLEILE